MLKKQLKQYLDSGKKTVIFTSSEGQVYLEKCLLEIQPAFFHVQVTTVERYIMELFKKHHLFEVKPLSKKTSLLALKASLEVENLSYFKDIRLTEGLVEALLEAFEMMADFNVSQLPDTGKWQDLKIMYQTFCDYKKNEYFMSELLYKASSLIEKDVCYVDFSDSDYSQALDTFFKKCHVETLEMDDCQGEREFYQVQFSHQEIELVIKKISDGLKQGYRYQDFMVHVPDSQWVSEFISKCPYPCKQQFVPVNNNEAAFVDAFFTFDEIKMKQFGFVEDKWIETMKIASNDQRKVLLEEVVCFEVEELPNDLDFETYRLFIKMLYVVPSVEKNNVWDSIQVLTYKTPILSHSFKHAFLLGLNEEVYPSKMSESALILNEELEAYYPEGTPLLRRAKLERERLLNILKTSQFYTLSCHFGSLDGSEVLPSLLYKELLGKQKEKKMMVTFPTKLDDISLNFDGQPLPLQNAKEIYNKKGISPSEIETYNACPYKHFLRYGMRIFPKKGKLETRAKFGTLMHDMLDYYAPLFKGDFEDSLISLEKKYQLKSENSLDQRLEALLYVFLNQYNIELEDAEEKYLFTMFPTQFLNTLKILLFHITSGEFRMAFHEEKLTYTINGITYAGRIDRADVYKNYVKIIDYKSSNKTLDLALALEGFNVQMAMYLEMLAQNKQMDKGAMLYFNTRQRKIDGVGNMSMDGTKVEDFQSAYQMEGWILEEDKHEVMYGIDHNFPESQIAHIRYVKSKDGYSGRLLSKEKLEHFIQSIFEYLHRLVDQCFDEGNIAIQPAGSDDLATHMKVSPCQYCDYQDVCMRDPFYHEDRKINVMKKDELENFLEGGNTNGKSNINE